MNMDIDIFFLIGRLSRISKSNRAPQVPYPRKSWPAQKTDLRLKTDPTKKQPVNAARNSITSALKIIDSALTCHH